MPPVAEELEGQIDARANAAPSSIPNLIRRRRCNMVRAPCCDKAATKKGPWAPEEDAVIVSYIRRHGHGNWRALPKLAGLLRCGKSCRLRWMNYLRPDIKRGNFSEEEEATIIRLHQAFGNRWSTIAANLPGRTDNEIKNVWHTHLKKLLSPGQPEAKRRRTLNKSKQVATVPKISSVSDLSPCASVDSPAASGLSSEKGGSFCSVEEFPAIQESLWMDSASYDMDFTGSLLVLPPVADSDDMDFWLQVLRRAEDQVEELPLF